MSLGIYGPFLEKMLDLCVWGREEFAVHKSFEPLSYAVCLLHVIVWVLIR